jgi:hypothetical protein
MMKTLISLLALAMPMVVNAHAVIQQKDAESGSYYKGVIGISHGCEGSATTKVTIDIPYGLRGTKPMPKAGWQLDVVKSELEKPYNSHGKVVTEDVTQISWYGNTLDDAHYDEFAFRGQIGVGTTTRLYFPVRQECVVGEVNWNQKPGDKADAKAHHGEHSRHANPLSGHGVHAGHGAEKLDFPAPVVRVIDGIGGHHH